MTHQRFAILCRVARLLLWLVILSWLMIPIIIARATGQAAFLWEQDIIYEVSDHPYFVSNALPSGPERVNVDLSLDGGSNWTYRIAHGHPSRYGTNIVRFSMRITPDMWTESAVIAVRTLWTSTTNAIIVHHGHGSGLFAIGGIAIQSPAEGETVYSPGYIPVTWREAGSDAVTVGVSTDGEIYEPIAALPSPGMTNTYILPLANQPAGPLWIAVADAELGDCYDVVQVQCESLLSAPSQTTIQTKE